MCVGRGQTGLLAVKLAFLCRLMQLFCSPVCEHYLFLPSYPFAAGVEAIAEALRQPTCPLEVLILKACGIDEAGGARAALTPNTTTLPLGKQGQSHSTKKPLMSCCLLLPF